MAGAPKNNKNAEKWNIKNAQALLDDIYDYVKLNEDCNSLAKAALQCGEYETVIYHIRDNVEFINFEPIKKAKEIVKCRLLDNGLNSKYNPAMCIFTLKNNHDMKDKQQIEQSGSINIPPIKWVNTNDKDK